MATVNMPTRHQGKRREASHASMERNSKGIHGRTETMLRCPAGTWRKDGAQNISSAAETNAAKGWSPRRQAHRYMNAPSSHTCSAMLQFTARDSGSARNNQLNGYSSADC